MRPRPAPRPSPMSGCPQPPTQPLPTVTPLLKPPAPTSYLNSKRDLPVPKTRELSLHRMPSTIQNLKDPLVPSPPVPDAKRCICVQAWSRGFPSGWEEGLFVFLPQAHPSPSGLINLPFSTVFSLITGSIRRERFVFRLASIPPRQLLSRSLVTSY